MMKERFYLDMKGLKVPRNHKFLHVFNRKLQQFFEAGISSIAELNKDYLMTPKFYSDAYPESYYKGPKILTLGNLEAGFVIWLCCISIAIVGFIAELVYAKVVASKFLSRT